MSKTWYPVINYVVCTECGSCIKKCHHGVYDKSKDPTPVVIEPDGCIQGCHGCGNLCPAGAIEYVGELKNSTSDDCGCECECACECE